MTKYKWAIKYIISYIYSIYYRFKWIFKDTYDCLNTTKRADEIIVSLTSFPGRINIVASTIKSILLQKSVKPDSVELWLADSQFPNKEKDLPKNLLELQNCGLRIMWCSDIRSFKKLIPSYKEHPKAIIVTADDDVYYDKNWLKELYDSYLKDKKNIHCHKATKAILLHDNKFEFIPGGRDYYHSPSYLNKLVGIGGVLYPCGALDTDLCKEELFMSLTPTNDDIWFWLMGVKKGTKVSVVKRNRPKPIDVFGSQATEKLENVNDKGEKKFIIQFEKMCTYYPEIVDRLILEAKNNE